MLSHIIDIAYMRHSNISNYVPVSVESSVCHAIPVDTTFELLATMADATRPPSVAAAIRGNEARTLGNKQTHLYCDATLIG